MNKLLLFLVVFLILGCTTVGSNNEKVLQVSKGKLGLGVNSFSSTTLSPVPGQEFSINLLLSNVGNETARNVVVQLLNTGLLVNESPLSFKVDEVEVTDWEEFEWLLRAPDQSGVVASPFVKYCYDYSSGGFVTTKLISSDVYNSGFFVQTPTVSEASKGPVQWSYTINNPIIVSSSGVSEVVELNLNNKDVGQVSTKSGSQTFGEIDYVDAGDVEVIVPKHPNLIVEREFEKTNCETVMEGAYKIICLLKSDDYKGYDKLCKIVSKPSYSVVCDEDVKIGLRNGLGELFWYCLEDDSNYYCYNSERVRMVNGKTGRLSLVLNFNWSEGLDESFTVETFAGYKYCLNTDPLTISVR